MHYRSVTASAAAGLAVVAITACSSTSTPSTARSIAAGSTSPAPAASAATSTPAEMTAEGLAAALGVTHRPGYQAYTAASDPNHLLGRHGEYSSKVNWGANQDNSIEVFGNGGDAIARAQELSGFRCPFGDGYDYLARTALLRLSCDDTPSQAHQIEATFRKVTS